MRILDRYILLTIIGIFVGAIITFAFLGIIIDTFSNLEDFIEKQVPIWTIVRYYSNFLPIIIVQTSPMALLIATLFTYSNLNTHNEIIAIRASGMHFWSIIRPALIFSLFVSSITFLLNERFVPNASAITQDIRQSKIKVILSEKGNINPIVKNLSFYGLKNRLFFIDSFNPQTNELTGITIIGHNAKQELQEKIVALNGKWTSVAWKFYKVQITTYNQANPNEPSDVKVLDEKLMDIKETPKDFLKQKLDVNTMNIRQLNEYIHLFSNSGALRTLRDRQVDLWAKVAFPWRNFIIVLLGLPLVLMSVGKRRAATFTSIAIALAIGFSYYVLDSVGLALGKLGAVSPWQSALLAPITFTVLALAIIYKKFR